LTVLPLSQRLRSRRRSPRPPPLLRDPRLLSLTSPRRRRTRLLSRYVSHSSFPLTYQSPLFSSIPSLLCPFSTSLLVRLKIADIQDKVEKTKAEGKGFFAKFFGSKEKSPKKQKVKTPKVSYHFRFEWHELMSGREI
jgi:hypothetical protein